jgi:hypothetical protein
MSEEQLMKVSKAILRLNVALARLCQSQKTKENLKEEKKCQKERKIKI